ncbi:MAG: hypothetical protein WCD89_16960 [Anaerocolumna sp.]
MRKKRSSPIQKQYKFEKESNTYLIEVSLDDYDDVYDEWDPAPFKRRFIEGGFDDFIVSSSEDIPMKYNLSVVLYIPDNKKDLNKEAAVDSAYKNYYGYRIEKIKKSKLKLRKRTVSYFLLAAIFLSPGYFFQLETANIVFNILKEGILIGGWVFLWEFFTNLFIKSREINSTYKLYIRLFFSEIRFIYVDPKVKI